MKVRMSKAQSKFLDALGYVGPERDEVDVDYLQEVHWELWELVSWRTRG